MEELKNSFNLGEDVEVAAVLSVGYPDDPNLLPSPLKERETAPRVRKTIDELLVDARPHGDARHRQRHVVEAAGRVAPELVISMGPSLSAAQIVRVTGDYDPEELARRLHHALAMLVVYAVSLPAVLHRARSEGRIQPGMRVLMIGTSAGISVGGAVLQT